MKKTMVVPFDLYAIYERTLEGVIVNLTIEYDIYDMNKNNTVTDENLKLIDLNFDPNSLLFIKQNPFSKKKIFKDIMNYFDLDTLEEEWGENLSDKEYKQIEYLYEPDVSTPKNIKPLSSLMDLINQDKHKLLTDAISQDELLEP